jgi:WD40 repeat protein
MKSVRLFNSIQATLIVACLAVIGCNSRSEVKPTKRPVTNQYHGVKVVDQYQWLENASDPAVRRWSAAQNERARAVLDRLPTRPLVEDRLTRLLTDTSANYFSLSWRRGLLFLLKFQPPAQQPVLITLSSLTNLNSEKVVLDPNALDAKGTTEIDWFVPSPDGKTVAICLSEGGSEAGTLYFHDVATGRPLVQLVGHTTGIVTAALSPNGSLVATIGMPSVIRRMVPSVEPGTPPNRGACPVACRTPRTMARTSGSPRSTRVARRKPFTACHSTVAPGTASIAR